MYKSLPSGMLDQLSETNNEYIHIIKIGFSQKVLGAHWREWLTLLKGIRESFPERWGLSCPWCIVWMGVHQTKEKVTLA